MRVLENKFKESYYNSDFVKSNDVFDQGTLHSYVLVILHVIVAVAEEPFQSMFVVQEEKSELSILQSFVYSVW